LQGGGDKVYTFVTKKFFTGAIFLGKRMSAEENTGKNVNFFQKIATIFSFALDFF